LIEVERVDFVSFFTQDVPRAKRFYAETLGLEIETEGKNDMEFRAKDPDGNSLMLHRRFDA
jgi:catechol 2,3-dioxygenase-like lactoylglutathione lyase family enzyme